MRRKILMLIAGSLLLAGVVQFGGALSVPAKAWLSVALIDRAWAQTLDGEAEAKPWPWMDSAPVAKIAVPRLNKEFVVMRGTSGTVLAFAPGWHEGTDRPGAPGISLVSAHRDTHFGFLNELQRGDEITLQTSEGRQIEYVVDELRIVMDPQVQVKRNEQESTLLLSTCFPFVNWQPGGEMRFIVVAREVKDGKTPTS